LKYTRFEKARILGARALQISMGAPVFMDLPEDITDPVVIAELEFKEGAIPVTVKRSEGVGND
jgi:DNA-directed RNA polymerase, subunit K (EC 2.7.7.6)